MVILCDYFSLAARQNPMNLISCFLKVYFNNTLFVVLLKHGLKKDALYE